MAAVLIGSKRAQEADAQAVAEEIRASLSVFRRERTAADEIPGEPVAVLRASGDGQPGEDRSQSRRVRLEGRPAAYLWPMEAGVCSSWGSCVPVWAIKKNGVALSSEVGFTSPARFEKVQLAGIVRDGIDVVTVNLEGGEALTVSVTDNAFWVDATDAGIPVSVQWKDADGAHSVPTHVESPAETIKRYEARRSAGS